MKFALVDDERREPLPGLNGQCPGCGAEVIARCGEVKVWHWAHKGKRSCDPWWEPETLWHRAWKGLFPLAWQEVPMRDPSTGELHIADVRSPDGLVLEFQHSAIRPEERRSRESFYGRMLWIVDGKRLRRDLPRLDAEVPGWQQAREGVISLLEYPDWTLPKAWVDCAPPVLFDFVGPERFADQPKHPEVLPSADLIEARLRSRTETAGDPLFCLLPQRFRGKAVWMPVRQPTLDRIVRAEIPVPDWGEAHRLLEARYPIRPQPRPRGRDWRF